MVDLLKEKKTAHFASAVASQLGKSGEASRCKEYPFTRKENKKYKTVLAHDWLLKVSRAFSHLLISGAIELAEMQLHLQKCTILFVFSKSIPIYLDTVFT